MLIPESLLKIDETVEDIIVRGDDLSAYYADIDSEILSACFDQGVLEADIPVDGSGYVTSLRLLRLGKFYGMYRINKGYNGIGNGDLEDVYSDWKYYRELYQNELNKLTAESITGGDGTVEPTMTHNIKQVAVII